VIPSIVPDPATDADVKNGPKYKVGTEMVDGKPFAVMSTPKTGHN